MKLRAYSQVFLGTVILVAAGCGGSVARRRDAAAPGADGSRATGGTGAGGMTGAGGSLGSGGMFGTGGSGGSTVSDAAVTRLFQERGILARMKFLDEAVTKSERRERIGFVTKREIIARLRQ